jgi:hypothetical protein
MTIPTRPNSRVLKKEEIKTPRKVLLIAKEEQTHKTWIRDLEMRCRFGSVTLRNAFSVEEAERTLKANTNISLIVIEACVAGNIGNTLPFVEKLRENFRGHVILVSNVVGYRNKVAHTEHHHTASHHTLTNRVIRVLGLDHLS